MTPGHPLHAIKQELQVHRQCEELLLPFLTEAAMAEYCAARFPGVALPAGLIHLVYQRTDGNPLFMINVMDDWIAQGILVEEDGRWTLRREPAELAVGVPDNLRQIIEKQLDRLAPQEQHVLAVGSVAGVEFSAAAVAAGLGQEVVHIEECCESLARRGQFLQSRGEQSWPDGTVAGKYGFAHAVYQEVVYTRLPAARRVQLHRRIGEGEEAGYGAQAGEHAAELAMHFERGREYPRAVAYLKAAADNALQRYANREAIGHLTKALALLKSLPAAPERHQQELDLQVTLGPALIAIKSQGAPEVESTYARALELCAQVGETDQLFPTLQGLCEFYRNRGALRTARELGEQLYRLGQQKAEATPRLEAHVALGTTLFHLGEYTAAQSHLEEGIALIDPTAQQTLAIRHGAAPGVRCLALLANTLWCLGFPEQPGRRSQEALALAGNHPHSLAMAHHFAAFLALRRGEPPTVLAEAEALSSLATAQGFPLYVAYAACYRGWALAALGRGEEGLTLVRQGLAALMDTGLELSRPLWLVLLAEVAGRLDRVEEGMRLLDESLTAFAASERGDMLAEAHRLRGELL
jgi:tetratricopeptide (TPR) repeat protein